MKTALTRSAPFLWLLIVFALSGRAHADPVQEIIGRWEFQEARLGSGTFKTAEGEKNPVAEFRKDGTFTEGTRSGTYRVFRDNVLRLTYMENGKATGSQEYQIRIAGDSLVTKNRDRSKLSPETKYVREK